MSTKRLTRIVYSDRHLEHVPDMVGKTVCLIECWNIMWTCRNDGDCDWNELTTEPLHVINGNEKWWGSLGCRNDVSRTAQGAFRVVSVTRVWGNDGREKYSVRLARTSIPE